MTARCVCFWIWALQVLFPLPLPFFKLVSIRCMPLCLSWKNSPYISNVPCLLEVSIDRIWPKITLLFTKFMKEGIKIRVFKLWKSSCQPTSSWKECLKNQCLLNLTHQLSNAKGCPFIKIWLNGSIRTSFSESYKIKQCLPDRPIRATIFVYHSWTASYIRQPNYVGFSKTGSDTPIEPIFDERTASDLRHLKVGEY